jgi:hypothetical protein
LDDFTAVSGAHHADDTGGIDGLTVGTSYRFLLGILGTEDSDWEYQPTSTAHNIYMGVDKTTDAQPTTGVATQTISYLCAECHGDFHSGAGDLGAGADLSAQSAWIRHPTDYDMGNLPTGASGKEYQYYNGGAGGGAAATYSVSAPVGYDLSGGAPTTVNLIFDDTDDAIVTCISCHRAHGSDFDDLLRWSYAGMDAGSGAGNVGCFICHTTKD